MASYSAKKSKNVWLWVLATVAVLVLVLKAVGKWTNVWSSITGLFKKKTDTAATTSNK